MLQSVKEADKMDNIDAMFSDLLEEIDNLSQSVIPAANTPEGFPVPLSESAVSVSFTDLNESLNELEDQDLDALVIELQSQSTTLEMRLNADQPTCILTDNQIATSALTPGSDSAAAFPAPSNTAESSGGLHTSEPQTKAEKLKLALKKLNEAKVRKLVVKVMMSDESSKILMVDDRQMVRELLDTLFEKTHCDRSISWSLCETNPELQTERGIEDHECLVELLSVWTRHSENKLYFLLRPQKYVMFTDPHLFYMWKKNKEHFSEVSVQAKELLLKENFEGSALIVPDLEGMLYLKEDGKKVWKPRYFLLRASGIYFVPKGKTKISSDLACFVHFENVNIYTAVNYQQKYRAPTDFCFILKHPLIQKESHYIKFLCCDNEHTLLLWVNSIRIAKYGTIMYKSYQAAKERAATLHTLNDYKDRYNSHVP
ncbi:hypothetical protein PAMA_005378 [Pampus argenteus]